MTIYRTRLMSYAYISIALLQYGDCQLNASIITDGVANAYFMLILY